MLMPGRKYGALGRYGFNGKENDNEVKGEGNQIDYGERVYDPRIGRFLSTDPLSKSFPWYSPYQYAGNNPILFIDIDGLEPITPEQLKTTVSWLQNNKPMYVRNFSRIHYELFTKRVFYGTGSLNKTEQNKLKGAIGEVIFAERFMFGFPPIFRGSSTFNKAQTSLSTLRHDVLVTLRPNSKYLKYLEEEGLTPPTGNPKGTPSLQMYAPSFAVNNADGSIYGINLDIKLTTRLYVEVKTYGINSFNFENLVDGFDQAIRTAKTLKGLKNSHSILAVDAAAFSNAISDPANRGILLEKLSELKLAGGHLKLLDNQNKNAEKELNKTTEKMQDEKL